MDFLDDLKTSNEDTEVVHGYIEPVEEEEPPEPEPEPEPDPEPDDDN